MYAFRSKVPFGARARGVNNDVSVDSAASVAGDPILVGGESVLVEIVGDGELGAAALAAEEGAVHWGSFGQE